jgi:hypothetical protein
MSPIFQGFVRLRKHLFGRQAIFGTAVPASRAYPFAGVPDINRNWTDPEIGAGSLDPVAPPSTVAPDLTASLTAPSLGYNSISAMLSAFFGGNVVPSGGGTAQTWPFDPASTSVDDPEIYTYEFGDDVLDDWYQLRDGILESVEFTGSEGLGPISASMSWRFGSWGSTGSTDNPVDVGSGDTVPTAGLDVDPSEVLMYLKDMALYVDSDATDIFNAANKIRYALHTFTMRLTHEVDQKRTAEGSQTFDLSGYGPGARAIELELTLAKTDDTVGTGSESDAWMSDVAVDRFVGLRFVSTALAESPSTFYGADFSMPMRYYTRSEGESGQNTVIVLTGHAFYDPPLGSRDFGGGFSASVFNTLAEADLGLVGS